MDRWRHYLLPGVEIGEGKTIGGCTGEDAFTLFQGKHLQAPERRQQGAADRIRRTIPTCTTT